MQPQDRRRRESEELEAAEDTAERRKDSKGSRHEDAEGREEDGRRAALRQHHGRHRSHHRDGEGLQDEARDLANRVILLRGEDSSLVVPDVLSDEFGLPAGENHVLDRAQPLLQMLEGHVSVVLSRQRPTMGHPARDPVKGPHDQPYDDAHTDCAQ